jgi:hypothetical protein
MDRFSIIEARVSAESTVLGAGAALAIGSLTERRGDPVIDEKMPVKIRRMAPTRIQRACDGNRSYWKIIA